MKRLQTNYFFSTCLLLLFILNTNGQNISLLDQFNGRYDFVFIGNTLNTIENNNTTGIAPPCTILTSSASNLNLNTTDMVQKAYLYWAGSGTGDFDITINNQNITAQRRFAIDNSAGLPCFSAYADVTALVQTTGNGNYTLSNLDLTAVIADYCSFGGNFGGWTIIIVYKNDALPLNQLNIYDGLQAVPSAINMSLNSLNVIDNAGAKIGFLAWEGDKNIAVNETLSINGNIIGNPPLNPVDNAFNGTNSITNDASLFNMDLDIYNIQNNINVGDTSAQIQLTSDRDFVMINAIITKLQSQLPDATIVLNNKRLQCNSRQIDLNYTVKNLNATSVLPTGTPIAIYANNILINSTATSQSITIGGSQNGQILVTIPANIPDNFILKMVVDDTGGGNGLVSEIIEDNNDCFENISLLFAPKFNVLPPLYSCNNSFGSGYFDFADYENQVKISNTDRVAFFENMTDASTNTNPIFNTNNYYTSTTPKEIFVRLENLFCSTLTSFKLNVKNCEPVVYNVLTPNNDGANDTFFIDGLRNIFVNFELLIYNRWGRLVWSGNNNTPDWDGFSNKEMVLNKTELPTGTYFYVLELNDPDFAMPISGYLYLTR